MVGIKWNEIPGWDSLMKKQAELVGIVPEELEEVTSLSNGARLATEKEYSEEDIGVVRHPIYGELKTFKNGEAEFAVLSKKKGVGAGRVTIVYNLTEGEWTTYEKDFWGYPKGKEGNSEVNSGKFETTIFEGRELDFTS